MSRLLLIVLFIFIIRVYLFVSVFSLPAAGRRVRFCSICDNLRDLREMFF